MGFEVPVGVRFGHREKAVVEAGLGFHALRGADPVDRALDLPVGRGTALAGVEVGGAAELGDPAAGILHHLVALDDAGVLEAHLAARAQPEILGRRHLHEVVALDENLAGERERARGRRLVLGVVDRLAGDHLAGGEVGQDHLDRAQDGEPAQGRPVQFLADGMLENRGVGQADEFRHADPDHEPPDRGRGDAAATDSADRRQAGVVPSRDHLLVHELDQFSLGNDRVAGNQLGEFVLLGQRLGQLQAFQDPVVQRPVHHELDRANAVGDALEVVAQAVGVVVQGVDAPGAAGLMVLHVPDPVEEGVAQPEVRRGHVDLRPQGPRPVGKFPRLHPLEEVEVLRHRAPAEGAVGARPVGRPAVFLGLLGAQVADVGLALLDERKRELIERPEVVAGMERLAVRGLEPQDLVRPAADQPLHVGDDGFDVGDVLLGGVGVVEAQVAPARVLAGDAEIEANGLRMPDVQIAVRLGREPRNNLRIALFRDMLRDDVADKVARRRRCRPFGSNGHIAPTCGNSPVSTIPESFASLRP